MALVTPSSKSLTHPQVNEAPESSEQNQEAQLGCEHLLSLLPEGRKERAFIPAFVFINRDFPPVDKQQK